MLPCTIRRADKAHRLFTAHKILSIVDGLATTTGSRNVSMALSEREV